MHHQIDYPNGIATTKFKDPQVIRTWISKVGRDDDFKSAAKASHDCDVAMALFFGRKTVEEFQLCIIYGIVAEVVAGTVVGGRGVAMFPISKEQETEAASAMQVIGAVMAGVLTAASEDDDE
jgi:hypothetical protein